MIRVEALLPQVDDLVCHYAHRTGGVSAAPFDSLNLGFSTGDAAAAVVENRHRLAQTLDAPLDRWVVAGQVHGAQVTQPTAAHAAEGARAPSAVFSAADAVLLTEPHLFTLVLGADCPAVVIADPVRRWVGVAHAGWRGTVAGVIQALVAAFMARGSAPRDWVAAVSPGICGACYEVGEEVFAALASQPGAAAARSGRQLDLRVTHRHILVAASVPPAAIRVHPDCTACRPERYFSHRRDHGATGRNGVLVGWRRAGTAHDSRRH
ncbi:MAG: peptidoglycan editing factor PgeF [Planctomycetota bacterium]